MEEAFLVIWFSAAFVDGCNFLPFIDPGRHIPRGWFMHQVGHFIEYFIFGILLARALAHLRIMLNVLRLSGLSVILVVLFAAFDEWWQSFVPGRSPKLSTIFFDGFYATLGVILYDQIYFVVLKQRQKRLRRRRFLAGESPKGS